MNGETATIDRDAWGDSSAADMERTLRQIAHESRHLTEEDSVTAWGMARKAKEAVARIEGR